MYRGTFLQFLWNLGRIRLHREVYLNCLVDYLMHPVHLGLLDVGQLALERHRHLFLKGHGNLIQLLGELWQPVVLRPTLD